MKTLLRFFSYLFHAILGLFLAAVSVLALGSGGNLHLGMLPWAGSTLAAILLLSALFGLVSLLLAVRGRWRALFFVWTLAVTVMLVRGYVFTGYRFAPGEANLAGYLLLGALLSLAGGWFQMTRKVERGGRY